VVGQALDVGVFLCDDLYIYEQRDRSCRGKNKFSVD